MPSHPPTFEQTEIPEQVGAWSYAPDAGKNAHVWQDDNQETAVALFSYRESGGGRVVVRVYDERVSGCANKQTVATIDFTEPADALPPTDSECQAVADGIEAAIAWMETTAPSEWSHPDVPESIFNAPVGYEFDTAYIEDRTRVVYYQRTDYDPQVADIQRRNPQDFAHEQRPYIYVHEWVGSGNTTVALAPWRRAHGPGSRYPEIAELEEPPKESGLEVGLTLARNWARRQADESPSPDPQEQCGQTSIVSWGEMA